MRATLLSLLFALAPGTSVHAQWDEFAYQINGVLLPTVFEGYETVDSMSWNTYPNSVLVFPTKTFEAGNSYLVMVFVDGCADCTIKLGVTPPDQLDPIPLEVELQHAGNFSMASRYIDQLETVKCTLEAFAVVEKPIHTVGMLLRKPK